MLIIIIEFLLYLTLDNNFLLMNLLMNTLYFYKLTFMQKVFFAFKLGTFLKDSIYFNIQIINK